MKVLVTGATGFVGLNTVDALLERGHEVVALVRETSPISYLPEPVTPVVGELGSASLIKDAVNGTDAVVHLAAIHAGYDGTVSDRDMGWERMKAVNVEGTKQLAAAADDADVKRFVFSSTFQAYPDVAPSSPNDYVRSKVLAGDALTDSGLSFDVTVLHPTTIMGPRDVRLTKFKHFWVVRSNRVVFPPFYRPGGRNLIHVSDVARSAVSALETDLPEHCLVTGENVNGKQMHQLIADVMDTDCRVVGVPSPVLRWLIAPAADRLHDRGLFPLDGERFRARSTSAIPERYSETAPVGLHTTEDIMRDATQWYRDARLL